MNEYDNDAFYADDCYDDLENWELDRLADDFAMERDEDEQFTPDDDEYSDDDDVVCVTCDDYYD